MAHDITFQTENKEDEAVYFFGYMEGIFYRAFNCESFDKKISGSNESITMDRDKVFICLEQIRVSEERKRYPAPNRFPNFYKKIRQTKGNIFTITFS